MVGLQKFSSSLDNSDAQAAPTMLTQMGKKKRLEEEEQELHKWWLVLL